MTVDTDVGILYPRRFIYILELYFLSCLQSYLLD